MAGNMREWVQDCFHKSYAGAPSDGSAWTSPCDDGRVLRGGSWDDIATQVRTTYRQRRTTDERGYYIGIRLAR